MSRHRTTDPGSTDGQETDWQAVKADLGPVAWTDDPAQCKLKSRDFFWFSPILKEELRGTTADLVAMPRTEDEVLTVARTAARHRVPLTIRGGGTGNYGQAVPLQGGIVLDMGAMNRIVWSRLGVAQIEAGARLLDIDRELRPGGWELRLFPSTRRTATLGGFMCGGSTGIGAVTWGQNHFPGAVTAMRVATVEEEPDIIELRGADTGKVMHAYGVNGIVLSVELPLGPAYDWAERIVAFDTLVEAARFAQALGEADGLAKKLAAVMDARIAPNFRMLAPFLPPDRALAFAMVAEPSLDGFEALVTDHGGTVVFERDARDAAAAAYDDAPGLPPIYEFTWNHTTLLALRADRAVTYLQCRYATGRNIEQIAWAERHFGEEVLQHLEFQRRDGAVVNSGLPLVRWTDKARLEEIIRAFEDAGIAVSNPHTYRLDAAGWKRVDVGGAAFKALADPHSLMNPGKLPD